MKTVIVTGGLGFIGSNLIEILNNKNYFIINIDKLSYASNLKNINPNIKNYKFYKKVKKIYIKKNSKSNYPINCTMNLNKLRKIIK
jgi:dTDP-glucose 4,6-dehydratase